MEYIGLIPVSASHAHKLPALARREYEQHHPAAGRVRGAEQLGAYEPRFLGNGVAGFTGSLELGFKAALLATKRGSP